MFKSSNEGGFFVEIDKKTFPEATNFYQTDSLKDARKFLDREFKKCRAAKMTVYRVGTGRKDCETSWQYIDSRGFTVATIDRVFSF